MSDLRAIAEAATPGPWIALIDKAWPGEVDEGLRVRDIVSGDMADDHEPFCGGHDYDEYGSIPAADAAHIATWSPDRALAALDVIEAGKILAGYPASPLGLKDLREALARWEALP